MNASIVGATQRGGEGDRWPKPADDLSGDTPVTDARSVTDRLMGRADSASRRGAATPCAALESDDLLALAELESHDHAFGTGPFDAAKT